MSDDLRERADDVIWRIKTDNDWLYLYFLIEFQSSIDPWMAVRLITYVGLLYQDLIKGGQITGRRLPPVLPIVFYTGEVRWNAPTDIAELLPQDLPPGSSPSTCHACPTCSSTRTSRRTKRSLA